jgi:glycosyltransferase involved in cell wall biosynthesis
MNQAPLVSVVFITYRRVHLLQRTVLSFLRNTDYPNLELVIADDGSPKWMQADMRRLPIQKLVASKANRGMGANTNAGLAQCAGKYILHIQDDWECQGPPRYLEQAVLLMEARPDIGLVQFCGAVHRVDPELRIRDFEGPDCYLIYRESSPSPLTHMVYSDRPHLKTKALADYLGRYQEKCRIGECELDYNERFAKQSRFRGAFFPCYYNTVFNNIGEDESFRTGNWTLRLESALAPIARRWKERSPEVFIRAKAIYRKTVRLLYHLRILRS